MNFKNSGMVEYTKSIYMAICLIKHSKSYNNTNFNYLEEEKDCTCRIFEWHFFL